MNELFFQSEIVEGSLNASTSDTKSVQSEIELLREENNRLKAELTKPVSVFVIWDGEDSLTVRALASDELFPQLRAQFTTICQEKYLSEERRGQALLMKMKVQRQWNEVERGGPEQVGSRVGLCAGDGYEEENVIELSS